MWPCRILTINLPPLPLKPPQPSSAQPVVRKTPVAEQVAAKFPYLALAPSYPLTTGLPLPIPPNWVENYREGQGAKWKLSSIGKENITSGSSIFTQIRQREGPFILQMSELGVLKRQDSEAPNPSMFRPHPFVMEFNEGSTPGSLFAQLGEYTTREEALANVSSLVLNVARCQAIADLVLMMALDVCALLGGRVYPVWPPNECYRGCWVNMYQDNLGGVLAEQEQSRRAMVRRLERYGVPLHVFATKPGCNRLDLGKDGRAVKGDRMEQWHQARLGSHCVQNKITPSNHFIPLESMALPREYHPNSAHLPTGEAREMLKNAIINLLDPNSPHATNFATFSAIVKDILPNVWNTERYEAALHPAALDTSKKAPWHQVRDGLQECGHVGALVAAFQVPPAWTNSDSYAATKFGEIPFTYRSRDPLMALDDAVETSMWYLVELRNFEKPLAADTFARKFFDRGVLGWKIHQDPRPIKDKQGRDTKSSGLQLDLFFKSRHKRDDLISLISSEFPEFSPQPSSLDQVVRTWQHEAYFVANPVYMAYLYAQPLPSNEREALHRFAPLYGLTVVGSEETEQRREEGKRHIHTLRHEELFRCDSPHYPTLTSDGEEAPRRALDLVHCPLDLLVNMAFSPKAEGLSAPTILHFRRMVLILQSLQEYKPKCTFLASLLPSEGPYRSILLFIANTIRRNPDLPDCKFISKEKREKDLSLYEGLRLSNVGNIDVFVDLSASLDAVPRPTMEQLEQHQAQVLKMLNELLASKSSAEKRAQKKRKLIEMS